MIRRLAHTIIAAALVVALAGTGASAYQASITAEVSSPQVKKGESFTYTLEVIEEGDVGAPSRVEQPDFSGFTVSSSSQQTSLRVLSGKARKVTQLVFKLSSVLPGEHVIAPAKVVMTDTRSGKAEEMTSNEVKVTVLDEEQGILGAVAGDIRDIKGPKTLVDRIKLYFYSILAIAVLALLILVGFTMYMAGKRKARPEAPAKTPGAAVPGPGPREAALGELEAARELMEDTRAYYTAVANALRAYLAKAYGIAAMEATTQELVDAARAASIRGERLTSLGDFLGRADMVKFAKHEPDREDKQRFYEDAVSLVKGL